MSTDCIQEAGTKEGFYHVLYNRYSLLPQLQIVAVEAVQQVFPILNNHFDFDMTMLNVDI
jgi:hypothetical protein